MHSNKSFLISFFHGKHDNKPKEKLLTWQEFVARAEKPVVQREKDGELFAPCLFEPKRRNKGNVKTVCMAIFDIDHKGELETVRTAFAKLDCAYLIHSTHSHLRVTASNPKAEPRYRVCVPLASDIPATRFSDLWQRMKNATGQPFDEAAKDASRMFYLPAIAEPGAPYDYYENNGNFLDWQALLDRVQPVTSQNGHKPAGKTAKTVTSLKPFDEIAITIDPQASIDLDTFQALEANTPKFRATWNRKRKDLQDQSGSSYDLALANFAIGAGLDDQTTVNLLISHRRKHNDQKERLDYYQRTLKRARANGTFQVDDSDLRPQLDAGDQNLERANKQAWSALLTANNPPVLFRYGSLPFRLESDDNNEPVLRELNESRTGYELVRAARWYKTNAKGKRIDANPPQALVKSILATPDMALPVLNRIVTSPIFAANGELQLEPGYHASSRTFYHKTKNFNLPTVSEQPASAEIEQARTLIFDMLRDFPFVGDADKCHAVALMLLPFARELINGATPLHAITAPAPGTGKSLLAEVLSLPATLDAAKMTEGGSDDEWRKRITAALRSCPSFLVIDNLQQPLNTSQLAAAITTQTWTDRVLGKSEMLRLPVRCVWSATGNNIVFSKEMARRTVSIALDAKIDRAWLRGGFAIQDLRSWVIENRDRLAWAALTIISAWLAAGKPLGSKSLGMFENWASVMGGICSVAGIDGFLDNLHEFYEQADNESEIWRAFVENWWHCYGKKQVGVGELWNIVTSIMDGEFFELGDGSERSQRIRLGQLLVKARDRQVGDFRIKRAGELRRAQLWALEWKGTGDPPLTQEMLSAHEKGWTGANCVNVENNIHTN